jgi:hypothetical protein
MAKDQVAYSLVTLQRLLRTGAPEPTDSGFHRWGTIPEDIATDEALQLSLNRQEYQAERHLKARLLADTRFEHLGDGVIPSIDKVLWRFMCQCALERETDHVPAFIEQHARDVRPHTFFFPVEYLSVEAPISLPGGAELLPPAHGDVPAQHLYVASPVGAVLRVTVKGTSAKAMLTRARATSNHVLAILRVGLRVDSVIRDEQLRFRTGRTYALSGGGGGWGRPEDEPFALGIQEPLLTQVTDQPLATLPATPMTDWERKGVLALDWLNRARLTADILVATLFDFFALEAILGDKGDRTKGAILAFRTAFLAHLAVGHYRDPGILYSLYGQVRSAAVHGSIAPEMSPQDFYWFDRTVRESLNHALTFAKTKGISRQSKVIAALDHHDETASFRAWIESMSPAWAQLLAGTSLGSDSTDERGQ